MWWLTGRSESHSYYITNIIAEWFQNWEDKLHPEDIFKTCKPNMGQNWTYTFLYLRCHLSPFFKDLNEKRKPYFLIIKPLANVKNELWGFLTTILIIWTNENTFSHDGLQLALKHQKHPSQSNCCITFCLLEVTAS